MEDLKLYIGAVGTVVSVLVFASPMKTFWRIVKSRSTEDFESIPYVLTLLSSLMWTYYGVTKPGGLLVATVNSVGVALFLVYAPPAKKARTAVLAAILDAGFFGGVVLVTRLATHGGTRVAVIGAICTCLSIFMYGSPLAAMKTVISTKSVEYMPFLLSFFLFLLSFFLFLNGGFWTAYAILDEDVFLGVPNGIGFIFGITQLLLYAIYMNSKVSKQRTLNIENEQQRRCLLDPNEGQVDDEANVGLNV